MLLRLLALNDRSITHRLSYHAALPGEVAEAMLTHPERWVRHLLAESFTAAPEPRARLLDGPESDAMAVAIGPNPYRIQAPPLPDGAYERLLNHERDNVRYETVDAPSVPDHVLVPLALNPTLPADLAAGLADHEDPAGRLGPSGALGGRAGGHRLADRARGPALRPVGSLTSRPRFPAAGLARRFADAPDPRERALALRDPAATPELVERLSRDPDAGVRRTAARDPRVPVPRLLELLADPSTEMAAAANPALPPAEMAALLDREGIPR